MIKMTDPAFLQNPYPGYASLRAQGPVHWSEEFCGGAWLLTDYADVMHVLRDPGFTVRRAGGWANTSGPGANESLRRFKAILARSLLFLDAPQHSRLRQAMHAGFKPAALQSLRPLISRVVDELLDDMESARETDFIGRFARRLPARVIAGMMGVDSPDKSDFIKWSDDVAAFVGSPTPTMDIALRAQDSLVALNEYFSMLLPERRRNPGEDMVSRLIQAEEQGLIVTSKELLAQCCTLLFAGHETTRNLLGNGLLTLLRHPAQWQQLQEDPSLMPSALKELLRFESPVQYTGRRAKADVELHGRLIRKGDLVIPLIGAANRDPKKFSNPEAFDIRRDEGNHLSFGYGPHVCIGATLTYLEAEMAFTALMRRFPGIRLVEETPEWTANAVYRSLANLSVRTSGCIEPRELQAA